MIRSLILRTTTRLLVPLLLLFSVYLLLEGHHSAGGGFAGGLIAAGAYALYAIAFGVSQARRALPASPAAVIGVGILVVLVGAVAPIAAGGPMLEGLWLTIRLSSDASWEVGTPLVFDIGIYLTVVGSVLAIIFELETQRTRLFSDNLPE